MSDQGKLNGTEQQGPIQEKRSSLLSHLLALRKVVISSAIAVILASTR